MSNNSAKDLLPALGWREWVRLPDLELPWIRAKIDSGAQTSALHANDIEVIERDGIEYVQYKVHPRQNNLDYSVSLESELVGQRHVRSSGGRRTFRPVIRTTLEILNQRYEIEVTLICRKKLKYRMLVGREALQDRFVVDSGKSYVGGRKPKRRVNNSRV